ncbi:MAG: pyruvate, phosphate dikinase, partial [Terriglobia bacterium]
DYRNAARIPHDLGTAVNIQTMVFGNKKGVSATGVAFTRNPATGENKLYGEFLLNAQGEDVVAGIRTPEPIEQMKEEMPDIHAQLVKVAESLERHYRDVQDIEFTVEQGQFYVLQTRAGKRTAAAAVKIAADMVEEGLITKEEAVGRLDPEQLDHLLHPQIDPSAEYKVLAKGLAASPGAATGKVVFDADKAESLGKDGEKVILARWETTPDDIHGIIESQGILTSHGGLTSHAAVVARGMGKPCVSGCEEVKIEKETFTVNGALVEEGDVITIDGTNGSVIGGAVELIQPELSQDLEQILKWADGIRRMKVRTNAELPADAEKARAFGAEGIGLCRTEHMFFAEDRLPIVRKMILSEKEDDRRRELDKLLPVQRQDFESLFEVMKGLPVNVRLLDPPLHEFLPDLTELQIELAEMKRSGAAEAEIKKKALLVAQVRSQVEANPMLGLRGCRLGLVHPEIYEMQVRAIMEAACNVAKAGDPPEVEIMIPLVSHYNELKSLRGLVEAEIQKVMKECGQDVPHTIGTMIEIPRAALTADMVADYADFFSFGTNDLTQTTFGFSRDDAEAKFLFFYLDERVLPDNPFEVLDADGVGALVRTAAELGRKTRPGLKLGICGEHGGEPRSISFCEEVGLDYVSCSPYRVPLARLAAAQAVLGESARDK